MTLEEEVENMKADVVRRMLGTPYECTSAEMMSGGTTNLLLRAVLVRPLTDGTNTIVLKHSKQYIPSNQDFKLDVGRCHHEITMLAALELHLARTEHGFTVRTPRLYHFDQEANIQVIEFIGGTIDLKSLLLSSEALRLTPFKLKSIGQAIGSWLHSFHSWASESAQSTLRDSVAKNNPMRQLRYSVSYGAFVEIVQKFPEVWEEHKKDLQQVRAMAAAEYAYELEEKCERNWGIIHGDFWSGNILVPRDLSSEHDSLTSANLHVIDWEMA